MKYLVLACMDNVPRWFIVGRFNHDTRYGHEVFDTREAAEACIRELSENGSGWSAQPMYAVAEVPE
jgi:hypothetical protein